MKTDDQGLWNEYRGLALHMTTKLSLKKILLHNSKKDFLILVDGIDQISQGLGTFFSDDSYCEKEGDLNRAKIQLIQAVNDYEKALSQYDLEVKFYRNAFEQVEKRESLNV